MQQPLMPAPSGPSRLTAHPGTAVIDPACWTGPDLERRDDWSHDFSAEEIASLAEMAARIRAEIGDNIDRLLALDAEAFDIGACMATLARVESELRDGVGFALLRGLPVDRWDPVTSTVVYWAMGRQIGTPLCNNPDGDMVGHVVDLGKDLDHPQHRGYQTNANMFFHVDQCDVVALLCLRHSKSGGLSKIASSIAVHNEMLRRHPDLYEALTQNFCWSRMGEIGPGERAWYESPVFSFTDGVLSVAAGFKHIEKGHDLAETLPLSETARRALIVMNDIAEELHFSMDFRPGDVQLLNGHVTLHSRTAFEDWPEPDRRRLLWRLWLSVPGIRPRSAYFRNWEHGVWAPEHARHIALAP